MSAPLTVGVLASGSGTLLQAILDGQDSTYRVAVVVSDRPGIRALERAKEADVPAIIVDFASFDSREEFSKAVAQVERDHEVGLAAHAGFMRILSPVYFSTLGVPAMNAHPALLPAFPGAHAVRDALAYGVKVTGTTLHFVDEDVDTGAIIVQKALEIGPGETEEDLHERIRVFERALYPEVIRQYAQGKIKVDGRRVSLIG